jgi:hypothetical protein
MDKRSARRELLRGSLAAPLVLTVSSASAAAVTSFTKCLANGANNQPTNFFASASDGWYRQSTTVYEWAKGGGNGDKLGYFYQDPILGWISVDNMQPLPLSGSPGQTGNTATRWLLVWFSPTGQPATLSFQKPSSSYLAATNSCYGSFPKN